MFRTYQFKIFKYLLIYYINLNNSIVQKQFVIEKMKLNSNSVLHNTRANKEKKRLNPKLEISDLQIPHTHAKKFVFTH